MILSFRFSVSSLEVVVSVVELKSGGRAERIREWCDDDDDEDDDEGKVNEIMGVEIIFFLPVHQRPRRHHHQRQSSP